MYSYKTLKTQYRNAIRKYVVINKKETPLKAILETKIQLCYDLFACVHACVCASVCVCVRVCVLFLSPKTGPLLPNSPSFVSPYELENFSLW